MAESVGGIVVNVSAETAAFVEGMRRATQAADKSVAGINKTLASMNKGFNQSTQFVAGLAGEMSGPLSAAMSFATTNAKGLGIAAGALVVGFGALVKSSLAAADQIAKTSDNLGLSTDSFQAYAYAAQMAGLNQDAFASGLDKLNKNLGEAKQGGGSLVTFLKDYDITLLANLQNTNNSIDAMRLLADAVKNETDAALRRTLVTAAMGRGDRNMISLLMQGASAMDEQAARARELGLVIREDLLRNAETASDQFETLANVLKVRVIAAVVELAPEIDNLAQKMIAGIPVAIRWGEAVARFVSMGVEGLTQPFRDLGASMGLWTQGLDDQIRMINREIEVTRALGGETAKLIEQKNKLMTQNQQMQKSGGLLMGAGAGGGSSKPVSTGGRPYIRSESDKAAAEAKRESDEAARAAKRHADEVKALVDNIALETANMQRLQEAQAISIESYEEMVRTIEAENIVRSARVDIMSAEGQKMIEQIKTNERLKDEMDAQRDAMQKNEKMAKKLGDTISDAFERATESTDNWGDALKNLAMDLLKVAYNETIGASVKSGMQSLGGSIMAGLGGMFGFGGGGSAPVASGGGTAVAHTGGLVGSTNFPRRYHTGGVVGFPPMGPNEVPIIAEKGERILTQEQQQAMGGSTSITVNIDARGAQAGVENQIRQAMHQAVDMAVQKVAETNRRNPRGYL